MNILKQLGDAATKHDALLEELDQKWGGEFQGSKAQHPLWRKSATAIRELNNEILDARKVLEEAHKLLERCAVNVATTLRYDIRDFLNDYFKKTPKVTVEDGCGCVFCDLDIPPTKTLHGQEGVMQEYHSIRTGIVPCTRERT